MAFTMLAGCSSEDVGGTDDDLMESTPGMRLYRDLFHDDDPNEVVKYVQLGHLKDSKEPCGIVVSRAGLNPPPKTWSSLEIAPYGKVGEELGTIVDIGFAYRTENLPLKESYKSNGSTAEYRAKFSVSSGIDQTLKLEFSESPHAVTKISSAAISGKVLDKPQNLVCVKAKPLIELRDSKNEPIVVRARDEYAAKKGQDLKELKYAGCNVSDSAKVTCRCTDAPEKRALELTYAIEKGKLGKLLEAEYSSAQ